MIVDHFPFKKDPSQNLVVGESPQKCHLRISLDLSPWPLSRSWRTPAIPWAPTLVGKAANLPFHTWRNVIIIWRPQGLQAWKMLKASTELWDYNIYIYNPMIDSGSDSYHMLPLVTTWCRISSSVWINIWTIAQQRTEFQLWWSHECVKKKPPKWWNGDTIGDIVHYRAQARATPDRVTPKSCHVCKEKHHQKNVKDIKKNKPKKRTEKTQSTHSKENWKKKQTQNTTTEQTPDHPKNSKEKKNGKTNKIKTNEHKAT